MSEFRKRQIEEIIQRPLTQEETLSISENLTRFHCMRGQQKRKFEVTARDIKKTLSALSEMEPTEVFNNYRNSDPDSKKTIKQVLRMELGININSIGSHNAVEWEAAIGLDPLDSKSTDDCEYLNDRTHKLIEALGNNIKKAAKIALENFPYTLLNPNSQPLRKSSRPLLAYRQKLAIYVLSLAKKWEFEEPCPIWQRGGLASPIVYIMCALSDEVEGFTGEDTLDQKEAVDLLKNAVKELKRTIFVGHLYIKN